MRTRTRLAVETDHEAMGVRAEYRTYGVVVDLGTVREAADAFGEHLVEARFVEVQLLQQQFPDRPDRKYVAIAARAT